MSDPDPLKSTGDSPFFKRLICPHRELVGEPDELGQVLCCQCGALVTVVLTHTLFQRTAEMIRRAPYHTSRCVETDVGWACPTDCPSYERTRPPGGPHR